NLLAALGWALAEQEAALGLRLGSGLGIWFYFRAPGEGQQWLARLLGVPGAAAPGAVRGQILYDAGACALARGDLPTAMAYWAEAADCSRVEEDIPALSRALVALGAYVPAAEVDRALALAEE